MDSGISSGERGGGGVVPVAGQSLTLDPNISSHVMPPHADKGGGDSPSGVAPFQAFGSHQQILRRGKLGQAVRKQIATNWMTTVGPFSKPPGCSSCKSELLKLLHSGITYAQILKEQTLCRACKNPLLGDTSKFEKKSNSDTSRQLQVQEPPKPSSWAMQPLPEGTMQPLSEAAEEVESFLASNRSASDYDAELYETRTSSTASSCSDLSDRHFEQLDVKAWPGKQADAQQNLKKNEAVGCRPRGDDEEATPQGNEDAQQDKLQEAKDKLQQLSDEYDQTGPPAQPADPIPVVRKIHTPKKGERQTNVMEPPGVRKKLSDIPIPEEPPVSIRGLTRVTVKRIISNSAILHLLNEEEVEELMRYVIMNRYPKNHRIFMQGEHGEVFYTVAIGEVDAYVDGVWMARMKEGGVVGEFELGRKRRRKYTVVATEQATCLEISSPVMEFVLRKRPELWSYMELLTRQRHTLARRLRKHVNEGGGGGGEHDTEEEHITSADKADAEQGDHEVGESMDREVSFAVSDSLGTRSPGRVE